MVKSRRAAAATGVTLVLAGVLLVLQLPSAAELPAGSVVPRFLGAEKDQPAVARDDQRRREAADDQELNEQPGKDQAPDHGSQEAGSAEHGQEEEMSPEPLNATELEIHYDRVFDKIEGAETLPPWVLVPVLLLAKQWFTFMVFGFDMRFRDQDDPTGCWWFLAQCKNVLRTIFQVLSCALVLNGYRSDWLEYRSAVEMLDAATPGDGLSFLEHVALFVEVLSTSGNFGAAAIVFVATLEQKCASGTPKYTTITCCGDILRKACRPFKVHFFPLIPCSTHWLPVVKHVYMFLLLPYAMLPLVCKEVFGGCTTCFNCLACVKVLLGLLSCAPLCLVTLTLVAVFRDYTVHFGAKLVPLLALLLLSCYAVICVYLVGLAWACLKRHPKPAAIAQTHFVRLVKEVNGRDTAFLSNYANFQSHDYKDFDMCKPSDAGEDARETEFNGSKLDAAPGDSTEAATSGEVYLLMLVALDSLRTVVFAQISVLTCIRTMMTGHVFASYEEVMMGRSWGGYIGRLNTELHDGIAQATFLWEHRGDVWDQLDVISEAFNALWVA
mmetsp:Transcript_62396/g.143748  ORF Transcript_62396/g.143748 Transcript_62396/m.143748 type:complete len:553 (+) Transcript_62396:18-1676(+)